MTPLTLFGAYGVLILVAMYCFVYIPNKKKQKKMKELHDSLAAGDVVVTIGGLVGRIESRDGDYVTLIIDEERGVTVKVVVYAVSQVKEQAPRN